MQQVCRAMYFIERDQKILGQQKKLYYSGSRTWTTHYDRRKLYKTYDEANKENEQFLRDILYMKSVKALQEAMTRIETLEAEVTALKGS